MSAPESLNHVPPVPRYGEYAPASPAAPVAPALPAYQQPPAYHQQPYASPSYYALSMGERPPRTADMVVSIVLLVVGFFGVLLAVLNALTINFQMQTIYEQYGVDYKPGAGGAIAAAVIIISHVLLYAVAVIFTISLIRKWRISFWLPLSAGVLASAIFFITFIVLTLVDPALVEVMTNTPV